MWELIAANKRKSVVLITLMGMLMIGAGVLIGEAAVPGGGAGGAILAFILWAILSLTSYFGGDSIFLASSGARQIQKQDHPVLYNIVEEMCIAAGISTLPKIYIIDDPLPNAFAVGRDPQHASVAVTAGLLNRLNRDEVQGVVAHELAHIKNRDILISTISATVAGAISSLAQFGMFFGGRDGENRPNPIVSIIIMIMAPIAGMLIQMAISRTREFGADRGGAEISGDPEALASALAKIEAYAKGIPMHAAEAHPETAQMMIMNPLSGGGLRGLFSTHPSTQERIAKLRAMRCIRPASCIAACGRA